MLNRSWTRSIGLALGCALLAPLVYAQAPPPPREPAAPREQQRNANKNANLKARIVRVEGNDQVVVRTPENKELTLYVSPDTRYFVNKKAGKFTDLRTGVDIDAVYVRQGDRYIVNSVTVGDVPAAPAPAPVPVPAAPPPQAEATVIQGSIVRVVGEDQVIVRTADGKEVIVFVNPKTTYTFNEQPARFTDLRPGTEIRIDYDVRDRRNNARSIRGLLRRDK